MYKCSRKRKIRPKFYLKHWNVQREVVNEFWATNWVLMNGKLSSNKSNQFFGLIRCFQQNSRITMPFNNRGLNFTLQRIWAHSCLCVCFNQQSSTTVWSWAMNIHGIYPDSSIFIAVYQIFILSLHSSTCCFKFSLLTFKALHQFASVCPPRRLLISFLFDLNTIELTRSFLLQLSHNFSLYWINHR